MKKFFLIIFLLMIGGLVYLWMQGRESHEISTQIEIAAPPSEVWQLLTDVERWPEWNPIIFQATGVAEPNATLNIRMVGKQKGDDGPQYRPTFLHLEKPHFFHWRAFFISSLFMTNDKIIQLEATSTGTRLVHKEVFQGMLLPIFCNKFDEGVPPMLNAMNEALKELAEKN